MDEENFAKVSVMNTHNGHQLTDSSFPAIIESQQQLAFSCNVWAGVVSDHLSGLLFSKPSIQTFVPKVFGARAVEHLGRHSTSNCTKSLIYAR